MNECNKRRKKLIKNKKNWRGRWQVDRSKADAAGCSRVIEQEKDGEEWEEEADVVIQRGFLFL
jgi:hypothetical protein